MSVVEPPPPRARIQEAPLGLSIVIPVRKTWVVWTYLLFLAGFLIGWAAGERYAVTELRTMLAKATAAGGFAAAGIPWWTAALTSFWLLLWSLGGFAVVFGWLWLAVGREVLEVDAEGLTRRWDPLPVPRARRYRASDIRGLRAAPVPGGSRAREWGWPAFAGEEGCVVFDYGAATVRCAAGLDEAEGRDIVAAILGRFPAFGKEENGGENDAKASPSRPGAGGL